MPTIQKMFHCVKCDRQTVHIQQKPNHILHLLLTLITFGLWIFVWISVKSTTPQCTVCGHKRGILDAMEGMAEEHKPGSTKLKEGDNDSVMFALGQIVSGKRGK